MKKRGRSNLVPRLSPRANENWAGPGNEARGGGHTYIKVGVGTACVAHSSLLVYSAHAVQQWGIFTGKVHGCIK